LIAYILIPRFYVSHLGMEHADEPVVVTKGKRVLDLNITAEKRRLTSDMSDRDAKASLMGGIFKLWDEETYVEAQRIWLDRCCQFSDAIEPDEQHTAWVELSGHPDPIATFFALREAIDGSKGGLAKSKWLAKLACLRGDVDLDAVYSPETFLSGIPLDQIEVIHPHEAARLEFLGYRDCESVRDVTREVLTRQFGERTIVIWNAVRGLHADQVDSTYPRKSVSDRFYFPSAIVDALVVEAGIKKAADRIASRLAKGDWFGSGLQLRIEFEDGKSCTVKREFTHPLHDRRTVFFAAKRLWLGISIESPVTAIRIQMTELKKKRQHQQTFDQLLSREKQLRAETALSSVRKVFGDVSVQLARDIQIPRRERVLKEWRNATGWS
jgi:hypothetical protein